MLGVGLVKERAVEQILIKLHDPRARDGWLELHRECRILLLNGTLALIHPSVFPGRRQGKQWVAKPYAPPGTRLDAPAASRAAGPAASSAAGPAPFRFGPWQVSVSRLSNGAPDEAVRSLPPASLGVWDVLSGSFAYQLPAYESYTIAPAQRAAVPALSALGKAWPQLVEAIPQVVGSGARLDDQAPVLVELAFSRGSVTEGTPP
jgi:hypothetical protein